MGSDWRGQIRSRLLERDSAQSLRGKTLRHRAGHPLGEIFYRQVAVTRFIKAAETPVLRTELDAMSSRSLNEQVVGRLGLTADPDMLRGSGIGSFALARDRRLRVLLGRVSTEQSLMIFRSHRDACTDAVGE